jgi:hypothetical protein
MELTKIYFYLCKEHAEKDTGHEIYEKIVYSDALNMSNSQSLLTRTN